jgi:Lecithin retinol acyltransferase
MGMGDHIKAARPHYPLVGEIDHHGIDLGDGTVVHFTLCGRENFYMVVRTNIEAFSKNADVEIVDYEEERKEIDNWLTRIVSSGYGYYLRNYLRTPEYDPEQVISNALAEVGTGKGEYHPQKNNCEHFATRMKRGVAYSHQVEETKRYSDYSAYGSDIDELVADGAVALRYAGARNPNLQFKSEVGDYIGSIYSSDQYFYREKYEKPFALRPLWYEKSRSSVWRKIDQSDVPYPLEELVSVYVGERGKDQFSGNEDIGRKWFR